MAARKKRSPKKQPPRRPRSKAAPTRPAQHKTAPLRPAKSQRFELPLDTEPAPSPPPAAADEHIIPDENPGLDGFK